MGRTAASTRAGCDGLEDFGGEVAGNDGEGAACEGGLSGGHVAVGAEFALDGDAGGGSGV